MSFAFDVNILLYASDTRSPHFERGKSFIESCIAQKEVFYSNLPHARFLSEEEGFWDVYRATTTEVPTRGNLVPHAHLAALLRHHGVKTLYTHDRDFLKFPFLDVRDPLRG